jgi:hypothetical protein
LKTKLTESTALNLQVALLQQHGKKYYYTSGNTNLVAVFVKPIKRTSLAVRIDMVYQP